MVELFQSPPKQQVIPYIPTDRPVYRVLAEKGFFGPDDTLHPEGEIIVLWDDPSEDMEPMNELASAAYDKVLDRLEDSARFVAEKNGRLFSGRPRSKEEMIANATLDARRVSTVGKPEGVPIMGAKKRGGRPRISKVGAPDAPEMAAFVANERVGKLA